MQTTTQRTARHSTNGRPTPPPVPAEPAAPATGDGAVGEPRDATQAWQAMLQAALRAGASDIHADPELHGLRIRFRVDGALVSHAMLPPELAAPFVSRAKVLCNADIAQRRRHQDGHAVWSDGDATVELRFSFYVTVAGESVAVRLLRRGVRVRALDQLGLPPAVEARFTAEAIDTASGVVLVTGPAGAGKTTSLYATLQRIDTGRTRVVTVEDPVEYRLPGCVQCEVDGKSGRTFATSLRALLRQDPDVLAIGEIRDPDTAGAAVEAALTGHKVFATFHTRDAVGALVRLLHLGVEPFLVASTVSAVLAQRLVPAVGGGRRLVAELLVPSEAVREAVLARRPASTIRRLARATTDVVTLREHALVLAADGAITGADAHRHTPVTVPPREPAQVRTLLGL